MTIVRNITSSMRVNSTTHKNTTKHEYMIEPRLKENINLKCYLVRVNQADPAPNRPSPNIYSFSLKLIMMIITKK